MNRRSFLKTASLAPFALKTILDGRSVNWPSIPYVDGLTLNALNEMDKLKPAGLAGAVVDASVYKAVDHEDGTRTWIRTFPETSAKIDRYISASKEYSGVKIGKTGNDILHSFEKEETTLILQVQGGGEIVGTDLSKLSKLAEQDLRVFQMTHHHNNALAGGGIEAEPTGLTDLGFEAIPELNRLGIIPDVSHSSDQTALDVVNTSKKPVILSHGAARSIVNNARCAPDKVIRAIADSGGVIGIFMMSFWLTTDKTPTPEHYVTQLRHCINVGGIDAVAVSNDFPIDGHQGMKESNNNQEEQVKVYHEWWQSINDKGVLGFDTLPEHVAIPEFNTINRMEVIHKTLDKHGFSSLEIEKLMGGNWIRLYNEA